MTPLLAYTLAAAVASGPSVPAATAISAPPPVRTPASASLLSQAVDLAAFRSADSARQLKTNDRDSLKNGALIGGITGGLALGGFVGWLCHALDETEGSGDCVKAALLYAGIGAAGGAAIGIGVDALFDRPMAVARVRF